MRQLKSLQFPKLARNPDENAEEWRGRLRMSAIECNYKEIDGQFKEQFIHDINISDMSIEITRKLTKIEDMKM